MVIFAEPFSREPSDIKAVRRIVERGGRVLSTGYWGGFILPGEASDTPKVFDFTACKLEPEGLGTKADALAGTGEVWMVPGPLERGQPSSARRVRLRREPRGDRV